MLCWSPALTESLLHTLLAFICNAVSHGAHFNGCGFFKLWAWFDLDSCIQAKPYISQLKVWWWIGGLEPVRVCAQHVSFRNITHIALFKLVHGSYNVHQSRTQWNLTYQQLSTRVMWAFRWLCNIFWPSQKCPLIRVCGSTKCLYVPTLAQWPCMTSAAMCW